MTGLHYNAAARHTVSYSRDRAGLHLRRKSCGHDSLPQRALMLALATSAAAQQTSLQIFRGVQRQVLTYPHFTIFDSVNAQIEDGVVTLTGKVTMPYKRKDLEERVTRLAGVKR